MSTYNLTRFHIARYAEAASLLDDLNTIDDGVLILRGLVDKPALGSWIRIKCDLALSLYVTTIEEAELCAYFPPRFRVFADIGLGPCR